MIGFKNNNIGSAAPTNYDGASPTTISVGGLTANSNITGQSFSEIIEKIVAPYINPAFTSFSMTGQATTVESGITISGLKNFTFGFSQIGNILPGSLEISDSTTNTVLGSNLPISGGQSAAIGSIQISGNGTVHSWLAKAKNTKNIVLTSTAFSVTSRYLQFFGNTDEYINPADIRNLSDSNFANVNTFTRFISSTKYTIAIPETKSLVSVITANNENITSGFFMSYTSILDAGGNAVVYKLYYLSTAIPLNINATIILQ